MTARVWWLNDLIRLEILLWEHVDVRLKREHGLPLSSYETLLVVAGGGEIRIGDLARELRITVGGASKLADRVRAAGLIERTADPDDRRASLIGLTSLGRERLAAATVTYDAAVAEKLDGVLNETEQRSMHEMVRRLLAENAQRSHS
ncbi:MarR family winged helix-turn-helix transcriptional regulator [Actinoplanes sp. TRM 88003]|uniref:MarR family winged helix-turn-helix transcriptional regulator n=1 Tax=Paractinoplanes aksuensis TaxID=2939490 RepID=A0ABT1DGX6_9ACTN|nr:MarR family winged helix-turn-helix transcriptional regulator [Actinoplanes aksuensis]MCO8270077.1 MarR family winged helix-turn-helix transcriptional regulator [Actinoplanes aksuensis]